MKGFTEQQLKKTSIYINHMLTNELQLGMRTEWVHEKAHFFSKKTNDKCKNCILANMRYHSSIKCITWPLFFFVFFPGAKLEIIQHQLWLWHIIKDRWEHKQTNIKTAGHHALPHVRTFLLRKCYLGLRVWLLGMMWRPGNNSVRADARPTRLNISRLHHTVLFLFVCCCFFFM